MAAKTVGGNYYKYFESYLVKMCIRDSAGLDGVTLTDKGDTVDVTLKTLNAGDKVSIACLLYTS